MREMVNSAQVNSALVNSAQIGVNSAQIEVNSAPRISWAELTKVNSALYQFHTQSQFGPD